MGKKLKKNVPELRFSGFEGNWQYQKLKNILVERNVLASDDLPLYSLTIENGIVPKTERYERAFLVTNKDEAYKVVKSNDFAYNPMNLRFGALARHQGTTTVKVSKYYNIFFVNQSANIVFVDSLLTKSSSIKYYDNMAMGSLIEKKRVHFSDFLNFKFLFPSITEQEKIASFLGAVDTRLNQLRRKCELLQTYKRGVVQKLFSQPPQLRFTHPDGSPFPNWRLRTLDELIIIKNGYAFSSDLFSTDETDKILLTPGNFHIDGGLYFGSNTKYYKGEVEEKFVLSNGDLLIVMTDLTKEMNILGNAVLLESSKIVLHNQRIGKILIKDESLVTKQFIRDAFNSHICKSEIREKATGSTVRHTSSQTILSISLCIPSIEEQKKISDFLNAIDRKIEAISQQGDLTEQFKKSLLQKMFV